MTGAVALLPARKDVFPEFWDAPTVTVKRREYLPSEMAKILRQLLGGCFGLGDMFVALEHQQSMGVEGRSSLASIMRCYGLWEGILAAYEIPYCTPRPTVWKKKMLAGMGRGKQASIVRATQLYPAAGEFLSRPKQRGKGLIFLDGRAEALLLAAYAKSQYIGVEGGTHG